MPSPKMKRRTSIEYGLCPVWRRERYERNMGVVRSHWKVVASISSIVAVVLVQTLSVLLVTSVANGFTRTAVFALRYRW